MDIIKRTILLEEATIRASGDTWGTMPIDTCFYLKIMITQNIDDMGLFTDIDYIPKSNLATSQPNYTLLINNLNSIGAEFNFMSNVPVSTINRLNSNSTEDVTLRFIGDTGSTYYNYGNNIITGATDSKLEDVRSYKITDPYRVGFDVAKEVYTNYAGVSVSGVNRIYSMAEPKKYVFDAITGTTLAQNNQPYGLQYSDYTGTSRSMVISGDTNPLPLTTFRYISEGWNETNVSLSALTKEEFLFGIISRPELQNDVFIDRGATSVIDTHLRLSEIKNLGQLKNYGNGFYNITIK